MQSLQSAVDSLQKEKEELVLALQSAKKDTNQAKYEHTNIWFWFGCVCVVKWFYQNIKMLL